MGLPRISPCGGRRKGDCPPAWLPPPATSRGDWQGPGAVVFVRNAIRKVGKPGKAPRNKDRKVYRKVKSYLEIGVSSNVLNLLEAKKIGSKFWRLIYSCVYTKQHDTWHVGLRTKISHTSLGWKQHVMVSSLWLNRWSFEEQIKPDGLTHEFMFQISHGYWIDPNRIDNWRKEFAGHWVERGLGGVSHLATLNRYFWLNSLAKVHWIFYRNTFQDPM